VAAAVASVCQPTSHAFICPGAHQAASFWFEPPIRPSHHEMHQACNCPEALPLGKTSSQGGAERPASAYRQVYGPSYESPAAYLVSPLSLAT
jgi:hypothetical protein